MRRGSGGRRIVRGEGGLGDDTRIVEGVLEQGGPHVGERRGGHGEAGRTEADKRVTVAARSGGVLTELHVRRGSRVKQGEIIAILSDDARKATVAQAQSLVIQRRTELDAKAAEFENVKAEIDAVIKRHLE